MESLLWPWPLAPLVLLVPAAVAAGVIGLVRSCLLPWPVEGRAARRAPLPIFPAFAAEILPFLLGLWAALLAGWALTRQPVFWAVIPWATVTTLMLWPVGRREGLPYLTYRTPLFVLGVLSMAYIIVAGLVLESDLPYSLKLIAFLLLPVDLTILGILPGLRPAVGRPVPWFFRPDLLFGDGRVLCCGTLAFVLGLRYLVGHPPPEGIPVPVPRWNWWAILYAIAWGFIPLIALRGLLKLLLRLRRLRDDRWSGWVPTALRELLLVVTVVNIGFGFHNAFKGYTPFVTSGTVVHQYTWVPVLGLLAATGWLIFVRGGYKRRIGDPFIRETPAQTTLKSVLYVLGVFLLMWSLMSILDTEAYEVEQAGYRPGPTILGQPVEHQVAGAAPRWPESGFILWGMKGLYIGPWNWVGVGLLAWGLIVLIPFRVLIQHYQREAVVAQMAAVVVPTFEPRQRQLTLRRVMLALAGLPEGLAAAYMRAMLAGLGSADAGVRALMARERVWTLLGLPADARDRLFRVMARALAGLDEQTRVRTMAETMTAVAELPVDRRLFIEGMAGDRG
jgi:hypothetical protein